MRKLLFSVAIATATLASVPAVAQSPHHNSGWNQRGPDRNAVQQLDRQLDQVERNIQRSAQRRIISSREAFSLRRDAARIRQNMRQASRNGLSGREHAQIRGQINRLEQRVRSERRDRAGRRG